MGWIILVSVIALPVVEIAFFIKVADLIGLIAAIAAAILAGLIGMALLRGQGLATLNRARANLDRGEMPVDEAFDGLCLLIAGALLLLPGFLTDILAALILLPPVRALLRRWLAARVKTMEKRGQMRVIEADYTIVRDDEPPDRLT